MAPETLEQFVESILSNLARNGFPAKRVSLPLEKMYEVAHGKGLNFNKALEMLRGKGIDHETTTEKVIFFAADDMFTRAAEMLKSMTPEQQEELLKKARDMGLFKG